MPETSLSTLVKEIGEALMLDDNNEDQEAYKKYISCIYKIATNLIVAIQKSGGHVVVDSKTSKQVKLAQQCVERVSSLLEKMVTETPQSGPSSVVIQSSSPMVTSASDNRETPTSSNSAVIQTVTSPAPPLQQQQQQWHQQQQQTKSLVPTDRPISHPSRFTTSVPSLMMENNPHAYSAQKTPSLTPMELARRQNQSLMTAYRARMERLNRSDFSAYNYSLTIQRKMAENIAIARAQEEELARKMQSRNLRLEEEAAKRFAAPVGMSKEEQEQRLIYKKILQYEQDATWLKQWRSKLETSPEDPILINQLVQEILRCSDHPFTELLHKYQMQIYQRLYPLVANKHEEIDIVQVPLPQSAWPSLDDVSDTLTDGVQSPVLLRADKPEPTSLSAVKECGHEVDKQSSEDNTRLDSSETEHRVDENKNKPTARDKTVEVIDINSNLHPLSIQSELEQSTVSRLDETEEKEEHLDDKKVVISAFSNEGEVVLDHGCRSVDLLPENTNSLASGSHAICPHSDIQENGASATYDVSCTHRDVHNLDNKQNNQDEEGIEDKTLTKEQSTAAGSTRNICEEISQEEDGTASSNTDQLTVEHGKDLESQMSWERRQAQLLMRQVTKDYSSYQSGDSDYDENKLDYLFDGSEEDDDDGYGWFADNASAQSRHQSTLQQITTLSQDEGHSLDSGISDTSLSQPDDRNQVESLPPHADLEKLREDKQFQKLSQEAYQRHLKSISEDIHRFLEKLLRMMIIAYEPLDNPVGKDQCAVSLEEPFFKPIWKTLLRLFRVVNHKQELMLACVMTRFADATPADFKVSQKLWLTDPTCKPYQRAITELTHVREHYTMLNKLECVVKVCRQICECVDDYYSNKHGSGESANKKAPSVGADDLLPVLSYVVVQSAMPQLPAECHAMTEFIHEGYMMGEEGYCLTSLRTAVNYVISLFPSVARHESQS